MSDDQVSDFVVVGGGIIGLSVAWSLVKEGASVTVLEAGQLGGQATGAAAGMLAPLAEAKEPGPFLTLGLESLQRYPAFVSELHEETEIDAELIGPGMLRVAMNDVDAYQLSQDWEWQQGIGLQSDCLSAKEVRLLEPSLGTEVRLAVRSPDERNVEPRRLLRALALACTRRGVQIVEGAPVTGFERHGSKVTSAVTPAQKYGCGSVVVAGGAWSGILGAHLNILLPVSPIRGQILSLTCLPPPIRHTIYGVAGYLVPKADGRIIVGATEDEAGFNARPDAAGIGYLLNMAGNLVPALGHAAFDSAWAGLRPASRDDMPILGRLPGLLNAYAACGHYRNGVLLTPITGEVMAHEMLDGKPHPLTASFRPERFDTPAQVEEAR